MLLAICMSLLEKCHLCAFFIGFYCCGAVELYEFLNVLNINRQIHSLQIFPPSCRLSFILLLISFTVKNFMIKVK